MANVSTKHIEDKACSFLNMKKYVVFIFVLVNIVSVKSSALYDILEEYEIIEKSVHTQDCVCVPYWQCDDIVYGDLVKDVVEIVDIRRRRPRSTSPVENLARCTERWDVCCKIECGKKLALSPNITNRIYSKTDEVIGFRILGENNEAKFAEFPWMLGLLKGRVYRCGASLIHPKVALTAAHCVIDVGPFTVRAGEWNWEVNTEPLPHQNRLVEKVIIHPHYQSASLQNDIALLILKKPFKLMENVGIACIPPRRLQYNFERCIATGWGKNSHERGTYQSTLKKVELPIVPRPTCTRMLQQARLGPYFVLHASFICAGGELDKDTCKGDGGSPLICPVLGQPNRYEQIGIVSWGLTCGQTLTPGVYVNVPLFRDWIDGVMNLHNFDANVYKY